MHTNRGQIFRQGELGGQNFASGVRIGTSYTWSKGGPMELGPSWMEKLRQEEAKSASRKSVHPWKLRLERMRGKIDYDGMERVTTQQLFDVLEVPQRSRTAGAYRRLAAVMAELGWTAVRVRALTPGVFKEQVRGYCRDARHEHPSNHI